MIFIKSAAAIAAVLAASGAVKASPTGPTSATRRLQKSGLVARSDCSYVIVVSGNDCGSLATECGITGAEFTAINSASNFCSTLAIDQIVCCSSGDIPDLSPQQNADGSCATYTVEGGNYCANIASKNRVTIDDLESFNKDTWGWNGCENLQLITMCISTGSPPMPVAVAGTQCGPQVVGTEKPSDMSTLADLNPCPLNACCDVWGQCGVTEDYCVDTNTGAPGTAKSGTNGCISNCGTDIVNNDDGPASHIALTYFEAYNLDRPCLNMDIANLDVSAYSHVHFAFGDITSNYQVNISGIQDQFDSFKEMVSVKRIISFGGWAFSTDPATYTIFRTGTQAANRQTFVNNIANFVNDNGIDGVDIDWEYPGEPDIPGIPAGGEDEGDNYLATLKLLKSALGEGKSLSIAAPASYWYLKQFPIAEISEVVDYIVYMAYDLHGQWDYGSEWANPGCDNGNCLRSHVNLTETMTSLAMVTKAGVKSNKIVVGVSSYGRSFQMTEAGCTGPQCTFTGPDSGATPGLCTNTAGYIAQAEIDDIISSKGLTALSARDIGAMEKRASDMLWYDDDSASWILVYDDVQWVSYMDANTKIARTDTYKGLNFAGTTDWAVDLNVQKGYEATWKMKGVVANYQQANCSNPAIVDADQDSEYRWDAVGADDAWTAALNYYTSRNGTSGFSLSQQISNFFHGNEAMHCEVTAVLNGCTSQVLCNDESTYPAGYLILNSFVELNNAQMNWYTAITEVGSDLSNAGSQISETFAPLPLDDSAAGLKIMLDILGLGFALVAAPTWNKWLKDVPAFSSTGSFNLGIVKDSVNPIVSNTITLIKDSGVLGAAIARDNKMSENIANMITTYYHAISDVHSSMFSGWPEQNTALFNLITDGKFLNGSSYANDLDIQAQLSKTIYGQLIPAAWNLNELKVFIIDTGFGCDNTDYFYVAKPSKGRVCYNDKLYYLATADGDQQTCDGGDGAAATCTNNYFGTPDGIETLDGTNFGGVLIDDFVIGCLNSYAHNNNANGWNSAADDDHSVNKAAIDLIWDDGLRAPGVFLFPVCSGEEAWDNWSDNPKATNFPCN